jgi:hypothetical protein
MVKMALKALALAVDRYVKLNHKEEVECDYCHIHKNKSGERLL